MKVARRVFITTFAAFAGLLGLAFCSLAVAQSPAGPVAAPPPGSMPAAKPVEQPPLPPPRQTILGAWVLNRDESDDPRSRMRDSEEQGGYGRRRPGGGPGGSGAGRVGYGGESESERRK